MASNLKLKRLPAGGGALIGRPEGRPSLDGLWGVERRPSLDRLWRP